LRVSDYNLPSVFLYMQKLDSFFSHAMKNVHYPRLPYKVHLSFSDFLFLEILDKRRSF
jgi:hypothetical protein